jgi:N-sulfoglucosamine sulfohydrolase
MIANQIFRLPFLQSWRKAQSWLIACGLVALGTSARAVERPNVVWITSEDNSCYLGCYGDPQAVTPNLNRLAAQGLRYRNAFANAPVCSTARSTLITGMHASSLGVHNHRSQIRIPDRFQLYPEVMRAAGYYCTNNSKEDYNVQGRKRIWDESSGKAHYRDRAAGQLFFAVFNFTTSHESQVAPKEGKTKFRIAPEELILPPYHPDTEAIRRDWCNYYDQITQMDEQVGEILEELEESGEAENTIVFYYSDHGGALPGGKRSIRDVGTRVPLIVKFPDKWKHLAPTAAGQWIDQPVSFVDLPATLLSLCNVGIPSHYEGVPFLGNAAAKPQPFVYLFRGRMDERYDTVRAIRTPTHRYIRNYSPHRPTGQHYTYAFTVQPSMRSWFEEFRSGRCNLIQSKYWLPKPSEEFYEIESDPYELNNLAPDNSGDTIIELRRLLRDRIIALRDVGFIPEGMYPTLAGAATIFDYGQSDAYPIERIVDLADIATSRDPQHVNDLVAAANDPHPVIRYWAAVGFLVLRKSSSDAKTTVTRLLEDDSLDVRVAAAEAIAHLGDADKAVDVLTEVLREGNTHEILAAQNALEYLWVDGLISLDTARKVLTVDGKLAEPTDRIPKYLATTSDSERRMVRSTDVSVPQP